MTATQSLGDTADVSPARLVAAHDAELRRARDAIHADAQQRLTHTVIVLKLARAALEGDGPATALVDEALAHAQRASASLRRALHELLPAVLDRLGLEAAITSLAEHLGSAAVLDAEVTVPRLPQDVETTAYLVVATALAEATAHGDIGRVRIVARLEEDGAVHVEVRVPGSPDAGNGPRLIALRDRVVAVGGHLTTLAATAPDTGSVIVARLPSGPPPGP